VTGSRHHLIARTLGAIAILAALCASVALAGCGGQAQLDPIARAAVVTAQQQGAKFSLRMQFSSAVTGAFAITANGYEDQRHRAGEMTLDLSGMPGAPSLPGGGKGTQMILRYPVIYLNMPLLAGRLPAGKRWIKIDLTKAGGEAGVDTSALSSLSEGDPAQLVDYLRSSSGVVLIEGHEMVNGASVIHYHATLLTQRILDSLPDAQRPVVKDAFQKLDGLSAIPVDVWVDGQQRIRRLQVLLGNQGASVSGAVTMDFLSYGPIPPISAPPAPEVLDAGSLLSSLGAS
jgi:hypothetical protein